MNEHDLQHLLYIQKYCQMVVESVARFGADYEVFSQDNDYFNSVSMSIMQIGEHTKKLSSEFTVDTVKLIPWHAVRGIRNMFAHEYITMDKMHVWTTAYYDIPKLLMFCDDILAHYDTRHEMNVQENKSSIRERLRKNKTSGDFDITE